MKDGKNGFIEHTTMMIIIALCLRRQHNSKRLSHWVGSTLTPTQYFACLNYRLMLVNRWWSWWSSFIYKLLSANACHVFTLVLYFVKVLMSTFTNQLRLQCHVMSNVQKQLGAFLPDLLRFQCQRGSRASLFWIWTPHNSPWQKNTVHHKIIAHQDISSSFFSSSSSSCFSSRDWGKGSVS